MTNVVRLRSGRFIERTLRRGPLGIGWRVYTYLVFETGDRAELYDPLWFLTRSGAEEWGACGCFTESEA